MRYLSKHDLMDLHAYVMLRYGGRLGVKSQDKITTALLAPQQVMFGAEMYQDLPSKAAALAFSLLKSRPFVSGNEATALIAVLRFLALNSADLDEETQADELAELIRSVGRSETSKNGLESWLRQRIRPEPQEAEPPSS